MKTATDCSCLNLIPPFFYLFLVRVDQDHTWNRKIWLFIISCSERTKPLVTSSDTSRSVSPRPVTSAHRSGIALQTSCLITKLFNKVCLYYFIFTNNLFYLIFTIFFCATKTCFMVKYWSMGILLSVRKLQTDFQTQLDDRQNGRVCDWSDVVTCQNVEVFTEKTRKPVMK